jgi:hypothetical protein
MVYNLSLASLRLLTGIALLGSVVWQVVDRINFGIFRPLEYFTYFSIVSAIVAGLFLVISGIGLLMKLEDTKWVEIARLSLAVAMIVVGVVYHLLLADVASDVRDGDYAWPVFPNEMIHTYAPVLIVVDYLLSTKAFRLRLRAALWVAVFPLLWLVFSVIRGSLTNWWPYWFINPNGEGGVLGVITYVGAITVFFLVLGFAVLGTKKLLTRLTSAKISS